MARVGHRPVVASPIFRHRVPSRRGRRRMAAAVDDAMLVPSSPASGAGEAERSIPMHPETMRTLANLKIADELAWAERQRRARLVRAQPAPDAVSFGEAVEHLSFVSRLRTAVGALLNPTAQRPTKLA